MAVQIKIDFDSAKFHRELYRNAEQWPKAVDLTIKTMARRAPVIVARTAAQSYNIAQSRLNPRNKRAKGSVSLSGGLTDLTLTYRGERLPIKDFKGLKPTGPRKKPYVITGQVVRGQTSQVGHWNRPHSESGRYSVTEAALRNGFSGSKALARAFQKKYGVLPSEYRNGMESDLKSGYGAGKSDRGFSKKIKNGH